MDKDLFVENVKKFCELNKVKPTVACKESGVGGSFLSDIRRGQIPSVAKVQQLAAYLGVNTSELLGEIKTPSERFTGVTAVEERLLDDFRSLAPELRMTIARMVTAARPPVSEPVNITDAFQLRANKHHGMVDIKVFDQQAAAGLGIYGEAPPYHIETYPEDNIHPEADFGIIIAGDSMEPKVHDGGVVYVAYRPTVAPGQIGIFVLNGQAYCRRLVIDAETRQVRLVPVNPKFDEIVVRAGDEFRTVGRVVGQSTPGYMRDGFDW